MRNYYAILGVSRSETPAGIRAAYRDAAKRMHPDHAGNEQTAAFQELAEAHDVLSDPDRRRQYNETLSDFERASGRDTTLHHFRVPVEPRSIFADVDAVYPSFEALADRLMRNFTGRGVPKAERAEPLLIEVILTPDEAQSGGVLSIPVPVHNTCDFCRGTGRDWLSACLHCAGQGVLSTDEQVDVRIPPRPHLGATFDVPLRTVGIGNLFLRLRFRVSNELFH